MSDARLFQSLAEMLAAPPEWSILPGVEWPLLADVQDIARNNDNQRESLYAIARDLAQIPPETLADRQARYGSLFTEAAHTGLHLYESMARYGSLISPTTHALRAVYKAAGVAVSGTELPDHASVELAFLAFLVTKEAAASDNSGQWRRVWQLFMKRHAGTWLPALGRALAQTQDTVYSPVGQLLVYALSTHQPRRRKPARMRGKLLELQEVDMCNLCGFCVQVCPSHALVIHETDMVTSLSITDSACLACDQCIRVCSTQALELREKQPDNAQRVLRESPRVHCLMCGEPMVSQAEWDTVSNELGTPDWLRYCLDCRPLLMRGTT